jgi:hypothetical protein
MKKNKWIKPTVTVHGDARSLIKGSGIPGKELGPGDGVIVDDNPVSGPR